jgi:ABC-type antimicrobial peptide transport system permease subunit
VRGLLLTVVGVAIGVGVALIGGFALGPARDASSVDPGTALRSE